MDASKANLILDFNDPYVYSLIKEEFLTRMESWNLVEPNPYNRERCAHLTKLPIYNADVLAPLETYDTSHSDFVTSESNEHSYKILPGRSFYWVEYERLDWDAVNRGDISAIWFCYRKALVRKTDLAKTVEAHAYKCVCSRDVSEERYYEEVCNTLVDTLERVYPAAFLVPVCGETELEKTDGKEECGFEEEEKKQIHDPEEELLEASRDDDEEYTDSDGDSDDDDEYTDSDDEEEDDVEEAYKEPLVFSKAKFCPLVCHTPLTVCFEVRNPNQIEDILLCDLPEINMLDTDTPVNNLKNGKAWIIKPSMTNQARGIHVITSRQQFIDILSDPEYADLHLWVAQKYISNPLVANFGCKFHIRTHVFVNGKCDVYMFDRHLALFSLQKYTNNTINNVDMHLTNVCYQKRQYQGDLSEIKEKDTVNLLHDTFEELVQEYMQYIDFANDILHSDNTNNTSTSNPDEQCYKKLPVHLHDSFPLLKVYYLYAYSIVQGVPGFSVPCNIAHLPWHTYSLPRQIALLLHDHVDTQMRSIIAETYAAGLNISDTKPFLPIPNLRSSNTNNNETSNTCSSSTNAPPSYEKDVAKYAHGMMMSNYVPISTCSEFYGLDFMIDSRGKVWLLEINVGPDFGQTGERLRNITSRPLIQGLADLVVQKHFPEYNKRAPNNSASTEKSNSGGEEEDDYYYTINTPVWNQPATKHFVHVLHVPSQ